MTQQIVNVQSDRSFEEILPEKENDYTGSFAVMGLKGDTKHMWNKDNEVEVDAARALFTTLRKKGYLVYRATGNDGVKGEMMTEFDPSAERIIASPPLVGG